MSRAATDPAGRRHRSVKLITTRGTLRVRVCGLCAALVVAEGGLARPGRLVGRRCGTSVVVALATARRAEHRAVRYSAHGRGAGPAHQVTATQVGTAACACAAHTPPSPWCTVGWHSPPTVHRPT